MMTANGARDPMHSEKLMQMSVVEHLTELRRRLIIILVSFVLGIIAGWYGQTWLIQVFHQHVERLAFFTPAELFFTKLRIAITIGAVITVPIIFVQSWLFVVPALYPGEERFLRRLMPVAYVLFAAGVLFGYYVVYPTAVHMLLQAGNEQLLSAVSIADHVSFFTGMTIPFGFIFILPLALCVAVRFQFVNPLILRRRRRHVLFWSFVLAAMLSPPDIVTQLILAVPTVISFEIGVQAARRMMPHA